MSHGHSSDKGAAFIGLIVTSAVLFVFAFGIVKWTNAKYAGHEGAKAEATQAH
ncbi:MAG TPA: hypothetical protein VFV33_13710 [Gemmatimonadaceae bacterium]|nr:hypothetical protein [Gemmatimonadaceae bacterium]